MPAPDADALREYMRVDDARHLEDYLARFDITLVGDADGRGARAHRVRAGDGCRRDGVRYIEVRYAPVLNTREGLSLEQAVEAPLRGLARAEREDGAIGRVIVCGLRHMPPGRRDGAGASWRSRTASRRRRLRSRRRRGRAIRRAPTRRRSRTRASTISPCTCHAGEGDDASSVREAVHVCGAHRIGHATRLIEDESLTEYVQRPPHRARDLPDEQRADARRRVVRDASVAASTSIAG